MRTLIGLLFLLVLPNLALAQAPKKSPKNSILVGITQSAKFGEITPSAMFRFTHNDLTVTYDTTKKHETDAGWSLGVRQDLRPKHFVFGLDYRYRSGGPLWQKQVVWGLIGIGTPKKDRDGNPNDHSVVLMFKYPIWEDCEPTSWGFQLDIRQSFGKNVVALEQGVLTYVQHGRKTGVYTMLMVGRRF